MKINRDAEGVLKATVDSRERLLASYLEEDVQESPSQCREILAALEDILAGKNDRWEETGNAHTLRLTTDEALITSEFDDSLEPLSLPLDKLKKALEEWLASMKQDLA